MVVIGAGQSALESAALLNGAGAQVEVIARARSPQLGGTSSEIASSGFGIQSALFNAGCRPCWHQPSCCCATSVSWLSAAFSGKRRLPCDSSGGRRLAEGRALREYRSRWGAEWFLPWASAASCAFGLTMGRNTSWITRCSQPDSESTFHGINSCLGHYSKQLKTVDGYPVLSRGLQSSIPGLHFLGKPAAWSFGPLLGFVSGTEFASNELLHCLTRKNGSN